MRRIGSWAVVVLLGISVEAAAYKQRTHTIISAEAVAASTLDDPSSGVLSALDLGANADDKLKLLPSTAAFTLNLTPMRLIQRGADDEDLGKRSLRHFFDPQRQADKGLTYGIVTFTPSPDWILEFSEDAAQDFSYSDAKRLLYLGLTEPSEAARRTRLGKMFESIGHTVHHLQDMAQPQHVRNDIHCDEAFTQLFESSWVKAPLCPLGGAYRPSAYEDFTHQRATSLPLDGYPAVDHATFNRPELFWDTGESGIAAFTSNNFVSTGTNFYEHAGFMLPDADHPNPTARAATLVRHDITDLLGPQGPQQPLSGEIWFVATPVNDRYVERWETNLRSSSYSIFDKDLEQAGVEAIFTLNRLNYEAANEFLLPRAAAYSTGLINYFFRGRIEIGLPEQGVYGIVDHATTREAGQGFQKLKLRLSNASPDGVKPSGEKVPQTMQGGTLVAVAKYTLNSCYQPDLSGDFAVTLDTGAVIYPANCTLDQYFAGEEQISQSAAILAASLDKVAADFTFDFSAQPIPVNARDLRIQVVYTGTLGSETDAIAFGGRDISEPTYLIVYNNSDYYAVDGKFYTPQQIRADATLSRRVQGYDIDPKPLTTVAMTFVANKPITGAAGPVPVNGYVRVAVLADTDRPFTMNVLTRFEGAGDTVSTFDGIWAATIDLRGEFAYITPLGIYRDPRAHLVDVVFKANSQAPLLDGELVTMSARRAGDPGPIPIPLRF